MKRTLLAATILLASLGLAPAQEKKHAPAKATSAALPNPLETKSAKGARVYIIGLKDGKKVKSPVTIRFGLKGMGVCPAGLHLDNTGHHHLLVDMDVSELDAKQPIPAIDGKCMHYGKGQTQVTLELSKGKHTLQLAFANYAHFVHQPAVVSKKITIEVVE